jgi:hypothetical protein
MTPDYKSLSRGHSRDMSSGTIDDRLDKVADLYELWKLLRTAKRSNGGEPPTGANRQRGRTSAIRPMVLVRDRTVVGAKSMRIAHIITRMIIGGTQERRESASLRIV